MPSSFNRGPGPAAALRAGERPSSDFLFSDVRETPDEMERRAADIDRAIEDALLSEQEQRRRESTLDTSSSAHLIELLDISGAINDGVSAIVEDSFTKCFTNVKPAPWNWTWYLFPFWLGGLLIRYLVLFPIRLLLLVGGFVIFFILFFSAHFALKGKARKSVEGWLVEFMCGMFVASWTGVVRYHGPKPTPRAGQVFVANHTSMIDFIILEQLTAFAVIMQKHPGWVGFMQTHVLSSLGCIWFNRTEAKDRAIVATKLREHVHDGSRNPLLIFPEGTCVNNEYTVMFKRGAFDLGARVFPIAIKYNKIFVDAFWNSRKQSFSSHLLRLMTSWAVVCDVYFLEPQSIREGESASDFASRVQGLIAKKAGLKIVPWDGYLKYYRPKPDQVEQRRRIWAEGVKERMMGPDVLGAEGKKDAGTDPASPGSLHHRHSHPVPVEQAV